MMNIKQEKRILFVNLDNNGDDHYTSYQTEKAMAVLPSKIAELEDERELSQSPVEPLPIYQQRDNYFS